MTTGIQLGKSVCRQKIKDILSELPIQEKSKQSEIIVKKLINLPAFISSKRVSIYLSTDNEVNTEPIIRKVFELNKQCYVPRYNKNGMQMVKLNSMADWDNLPVTKWNIKQPALKEEREDALETGGFDLMIVPGVGFSKSGARLGHGKGYYDTYFQKVFSMQEKRPITIAIGFREQMQDEIPVHEHDVILDMVIHPDY